MISSIGIDIRHSELKHTSLSWDTLLSLMPNAPPYLKKQQFFYHQFFNKLMKFILSDGE